MAAITPDRFDPLKAFCNVRLQQGVPLVDADVNELDDIRKFEVRAFLKWFVGDGVPSGNDGFRVDAIGASATPPLTTPAPDDFWIRVGAQSIPASPEDTARPHAGAALRNCGRCIVDGLDVIIQRDATYKGQPLFASAALGVPQVAAIPGASVFVLVYLDVWERLVTSLEDSSLIVPSVATESCARLKREWVIRTRTLASATAPSAPISTDPDFSPDNKHSYYALALITRRFVAGVAAPLLPSDITDLRDRGLSIPSSTLVTDALGVDPVQYRRGVGRPAVSLREAVNALLRGERPGTGELVIAPAPAQLAGTFDTIARAFAFDGMGGLNAFWTSNRANNPTATLPTQIYGARLDPANLAGGFVLPAQSPGTTGVTHADPSAVTLPNGDLLVIYDISVNQPPPHTVFFQRVPSGGSLNPANELVVFNAAGGDRIAPFAVVSTIPNVPGGYVVFLWRSANNGMMMFLRRQYTATWAEADAKWVVADGSGVTLPAQGTIGTTGAPHAAAGADGNVWVAFQVVGSPSALQMVRITPSTGAVLAQPALPALLSGQATPYADPFVLIDSGGVVWVFFDCSITSSIYLQQYTSAGVAIGTPQIIVGPGQPGQQGAATILPGATPCAALDRRGGVWLFWSSFTAPTRIWCARWSPVTHTWAAASQAAGPATNDTAQTAQQDSAPFVMLGPTGALWLFWQRQFFGLPAIINLFFRQIVTEV